MTAKILDGAAIAKSIRRELAAEIQTWHAQDRRPPGIAVILVGNDPASEVYVRGKRRDCDEVGFPLYRSAPECQRHPTRPGRSRESAERATLPSTAFWCRPHCPTTSTKIIMIDCIDPDKDVDGFHAYNIGRLALRRPVLCAAAHPKASCSCWNIRASTSLAWKRWYWVRRTTSGGPWDWNCCWPDAR